MLHGLVLQLQVRATSGIPQTLTVSSCAKKTLFFQSKKMHCPVQTAASCPSGGSPSHCVIGSTGLVRGGSRFHPTPLPQRTPILRCQMFCRGIRSHVYRIHPCTSCTQEKTHPIFYLDFLVWNHIEKKVTSYSCKNAPQVLVLKIGAKGCVLHSGGYGMIAIRRSCWQIEPPPLPRTAFWLRPGE